MTQALYGHGMKIEQLADAGQLAAHSKAAYTTSAAGGILSVLTFNEIIGAVGVFCSIALAAFTAWSNHKRNKAQIALAEAQMRGANSKLDQIYKDN